MRLKQRSRSAFSNESGWVGGASRSSINHSSIPQKWADLNVRSAHFWGMDEWFMDDREAPPTHPLSFEKADRDLCFSRIRKELVMSDANLHFPKANTAAYRKTWQAGVRCAVMQGG